MAVVVGARHSDIVEQGGPRLAVHLVGDRTAVRPRGREEDRRGVGGDPGRHPQLDVRESRIQEGRRSAIVACPNLRGPGSLPGGSRARRTALKGRLHRMATTTRAGITNINAEKVAAEVNAFEAG
jgi:hypothetical protein